MFSCFSFIFVAVVIYISSCKEKCWKNYSIHVFKLLKVFPKIFFPSQFSIFILGQTPIILRLRCYVPSSLTLNLIIFSPFSICSTGWIISLYLSFLSTNPFLTTFQLDLNPILGIFHFSYCPFSFSNFHLMHFYILFSHYI